MDNAESARAPPADPWAAASAPPTDSWHGSPVPASPPADPWAPGSPSAAVPPASPSADSWTQHAEDSPGAAAITPAAADPWAQQAEVPVEDAAPGRRKFNLRDVRKAVARKTGLHGVAARARKAAAAAASGKRAAAPATEPAWGSDNATAPDAGPPADAEPPADSSPAADAAAPAGLAIPDAHEISPVAAVPASLRFRKAAAKMTGVHKAFSPRSAKQPAADADAAPADAAAPTVDPAPSAAASSPADAPTVSAVPAATRLRKAAAKLTGKHGAFSKKDAVADASVPTADGAPAAQRFRKAAAKLTGKHGVFSKKNAVPAVADASATGDAPAPAPAAQRFRQAADRLTLALGAFSKRETVDATAEASRGEPAEPAKKPSLRRLTKRMGSIAQLGRARRDAGHEEAKADAPAPRTGFALGGLFKQAPPAAHHPFGLFAHAPDAPPQPWTARAAEAVRAGLDAFEADERAMCTANLWIERGDAARCASVKADLGANPAAAALGGASPAHASKAVAAAIDAGEPHAAIDAVLALLKLHVPLATTITRTHARDAFVGAATRGRPADQRDAIQGLVDDLPPAHRQLLGRLAAHLARIVRRQRLNGASWRGLAAALCPVLLPHAKGAPPPSTTAKIQAAIACERLLRVVNAGAGGPKSPRPPASPRAWAPLPPPAAAPSFGADLFSHLPSSPFAAAAAAPAAAAERPSARPAMRPPDHHPPDWAPPMPAHVPDDPWPTALPAQTPEKSPARSLFSDAPLASPPMPPQMPMTGGDPWPPTDAADSWPQTAVSSIETAAMPPPMPSHTPQPAIAAAPPMPAHVPDRPPTATAPVEARVVRATYVDEVDSDDSDDDEREWSLRHALEEYGVTKVRVRGAAGVALFATEKNASNALGAHRVGSWRLSSAIRVDVSGEHILYAGAASLVVEDDLERLLAAGT